MAQNQEFRNKPYFCYQLNLTRSHDNSKVGYLVFLNEDMVLGQMDIHWQNKNKKLTSHYTKNEFKIDHTSKYKINP